MFKDVSICSKSDCWLPKNVVNTLKIFWCCYQDQEDVMDASSSDVIINPFSTSLCFSFVCSSVGMLILGDWPKWSSTHFSITMVKNPKWAKRCLRGSWELMSSCWSQHWWDAVCVLEVQCWHIQGIPQDAIWCEWWWSCADRCQWGEHMVKVSVLLPIQCNAI